MLCVQTDAAINTDFKRGFQCFAQQQARYLIGIGWRKKAYLTGLDSDGYSHLVHHGASCPDANTNEQCPPNMPGSAEADFNDLLGGLIWNALVRRCCCCFAVPWCCEVWWQARSCARPAAACNALLATSASAEIVCTLRHLAQSTLWPHKPPPHIAQSVSETDVAWGAARGRAGRHAGRQHHGGVAGQQRCAAAALRQHRLPRQQLARVPAGHRHAAQEAGARLLLLLAPSLAHMQASRHCELAASNIWCRIA